ncbi:PAQR family membrane homeostasis protein TrhA [Marinospirillum perlucidum]|uniref:PAQR family membrane homeostasis protein TrhA n=1 Tax=Marinospirillum perlucidum TaxID=1982602 RepID=UPI000DF4BD70|nr:hemolysin III family protein [Marinospirillum perlucidum]
MYYGEKFNAWTHLLGTLLAIAGGVYLLVLASFQGDPWKITSMAIYGATLVILYTNSTLYHSLKGKAKRVLQKLDHLSIYLLIAGSYTPFCLVSLRGPWGWTLFGIVWGLALVGMLQEIKPRSPARVLSVVIYAVMGWIVLIAVPPLIEALTPAGFALLATGGGLYTLGIVFYAYDERFRHWHGIWHLFVLGGSLTHYLAVLLYVV